MINAEWFRMDILSIVVVCFFVGLVGTIIGLVIRALLKYIWGGKK